MKIVKSLVIMAASAGIAMSAFANATPSAPQSNPCQAQLAQCKENHHNSAAQCEKTATNCNAKFAKQEPKVQAQQQQQQN